MKESVKRQEENRPRRVMMDPEVRKRLMAPAANSAEALEVWNLLSRPGIPDDLMQEMYSLFAPHNDHTFSLLDSHEEPNIVADELISHIKHNKSTAILDCCSGTGQVGERLKKFGFHNVTALDGNEQMLAEAKKKNVYFDFLHATIGSVPVPVLDGTYEALACAGAFYEGDLKPDCLLEFIRMVKPGGHIVLGVPEKNLTTVEALRGKLEPTMKLYEERRLWKMVQRKVVPNYVGDLNGVVFHFQPLPTKDRSVHNKGTRLTVNGCLGKCNGVHCKDIHADEIIR